MKKRSVRKIKKKELFKNLTLLLGSIIIFLFCTEILMRIFSEKPPITDKGLYIYLNNSVLPYKLKPNYKGLILDKEIYINSNGFRDKDYTYKKPSNTFRIAVIGDSFTFGWGVEQDETYPEILEQKLNVMKPNNLKYEVLNFGFPNGNTIQEVEILKTKVLDYSPDLVIIGFYYNDIEGIAKKNKSSETKNMFTVIYNLDQFLSEKSRFFSYLKFKLQNTKPIVSIFHKTSTVPYVLNLFEENSTIFVAFKASLQKIGDLTRENNISVLLVVHPLLTNVNNPYPLSEIHRKVRNLAEDEGFSVLDILDYLDGRIRSELRLKTMYDWHPNFIYYNITANAIYETLIKENIIPIG